MLSCFCSTTQMTVLKYSRLNNLYIWKNLAETVHFKTRKLLQELAYSLMFCLIFSFSDDCRVFTSICIVVSNCKQACSALYGHLRIPLCVCVLF